MSYDKFYNQKGFTLLEVLISFVILSTMLGVIYQMLSLGTMQSIKSENESEALLIARSKLSEPIGAMGQMVGESKEYSWVLTTQPVTGLDDGDYPAKLVNVHIAVSWNEQKIVELETRKLVWNTR